jgi:hypothetical protein
MPSPAKLPTTPVIAPKRLISPTPAGPRNTATNLLRTTAASIVTSDEPPMTAEEVRI